MVMSSVTKMNTNNRMEMNTLQVDRISMVVSFVVMSHTMAT
jgi:hypothetical protein